MTATKEEKLHPTVYVVFISLLLDLLAFTMILPLLPSLLDYYKQNDSVGIYKWLNTKIQYFQDLVGAPEKYNSVLFGGFLGSMYSFLQFVASPIVGSLSDVFGRKLVMIICLTGIASSYLFWALSTNFGLFVLARFIGGISKGNVSLSMAVIADVSSMKTRGRGMALVGIAFSLGFIIGPVIGASFAVWAKKMSGEWFVVPALFAFFLAGADLAFFAAFFHESLPAERRETSLSSSIESAKSLINLNNLFKFEAVTGTTDAELRELRTLGRVYFVYLFIYSGLEFTLTFLTHHVFDYNSMQQGWMFFLIGLIMAIVQGGYVRRLPQSEIKTTAIRGLWIIIPSFLSVGIAQNLWLLYFGLILFAISTAMVVPCMMTMASQYGNERQKGTVMGIFRSLGALARAVGPIFASIAFWSIGSRATYLIGGAALLWPVLTLSKKI